MNNNDKGYLYEIQIRDYIISQNKMAYLWSHTPENILIEHNIIGSHNEARLKRKENRINNLIDTGIDIIQIDNNILSLVQCKNGYKKGLTMNDLAGFWGWMAHLDKLNGYVYYTDKLSINLKCMPVNPRIQFIKHPYNQDFNQDIVVSTDKFIVDEDKLKYQMEAYELAKEYYQENINGIISMPCGTGKTFVSYLIKKMFRQIIILSPLKQFAKQNLDRYIEYGYPYNTLLVDSDGCRDIEKIKDFINNNKRFVISATFDSIDVIYECMEFMHKPFFIIDEFHNLSKNNVTNEDDIFYKVINSKHRKLFMSATPRVYEMEYETYMFYDVVFGSTIYSMSFTDAIKSNYITDYTIWLPSIHENTELLDKDLSVYEIDDVIKSKCKFLYSCLVNNGSRKCIIYCTDTNEITNMMRAIEQLDDYYM
jgi:predicted helicase